MAYPSGSDLPVPIYVALALIVIALGVPVIRWMLRRVAVQGGHRPGDAAGYALQVLAQSEAFRGDDPGQRVPWDGDPRLTGVEGNDSGG